MIVRSIKSLEHPGAPHRNIIYEEISGKGTKYRLLKTHWCNAGITVNAELGAYVKLNSKGFLRVGAGYEWNGPNVVVDNKSTMRASLIHDALCQLVEIGQLSDMWIPVINDMFEQHCIEDGLPVFLAKAYRKGLYIGWKEWQYRR